MSNKLSIAQRLKALKRVGDSFSVKTKAEREAVCRMAKALHDIEAIQFNITTRATETGFNVIAIP